MEITQLKLEIQLLRTSLCAWEKMKIGNGNDLTVKELQKYLDSAHDAFERAEKIDSSWYTQAYGLYLDAKVRARSVGIVVPESLKTDEDDTERREP